MAGDSSNGANAQDKLKKKILKVISKHDLVCVKELFPNGEWDNIVFSTDIQLKLLNFK